MNKLLNLILTVLLAVLLSPLHAGEVVGKASHADPPRINEDSPEGVAQFLTQSAQNTAAKTKNVEDNLPQKIKEAEKFSKIFQNERAKKACLVMKTCQKWALEEFKKDSAFRVADISVIHSNFITENAKRKVKRIDLRFMFNKNTACRTQNRFSIRLIP